MSISRIFEYQGNEVRTIIIDGQVWLVAKDVCDVLSIRWNGNDSLNSIKAQWKRVWKFHTPAGNQEVICINEPALYKFISRSNKPEAEKFMDWVYEDVLPQIRETGGYNPKSKTTLEILFDTVKELVDINHKVEDHEDRIINLEGGKVSKGYYTVKRFACKHGFIVGKPGDWKMLGKKCTAACKANGIRIERQLDDNYDEVNAYPEHILEDVFMIEGVQRRSKAG